jgi:apolipoprotein N-acyltransferase
VSIIIYYNTEDQGKKIEVVAVQPNIDPYDEKFTTSLYDQLETISKLIRTKVTENTRLIVAPETAISSPIEESEFKRGTVYEYLKNFKLSIGNPIFYYGVSSYQFFDQKHSVASRKLEGGPGYIEHYNSSLMIDKQGEIDFIHKSKLVPGVEKIPFAKNFSFLEGLSIDLGGTTGTLGVEDEPRVFRSTEFQFAPVVCYESIFGEFVAIQCRKGAELICIATNDGWWKNTPGYKQHKSFASLRAIENRRSVVRSANTGISCFVNQRGDISQETSWWVADVIRGKVSLNKEMSFYTTYGNVLGRSFGFVSLLLILFTITKRFKKYVLK